MGGLSRRNTIVEKLKSEGPAVVVDAGDLFWKSSVISATEVPQQTEKARLLAQGVALVGIDAMLPGEGDLALGLPLLKDLAEANHLPYVAANLECGGDKPFPALRTVDVAGQHIAIVGIVGNAVQAPGCHVGEPVAAAKAALEGVSADVVVLLSGQKIKEDDALAAAVPQVSLVVNGHDRQQLEQPRSLPNGGLLLGAGARGKQLGVFQYTLTPGATRWQDGQTLGRLAEKRDRRADRMKELRKKLAEAPDDKAKERLQHQIDFFQKQLDDADAELKAAAEGQTGSAHAGTNRLVDLDTAVADHVATAALVTATKAKIEALVPVAPAKSALADGPFAGSSACTACHAAQAAQWSGTAHPKAYASLQAQNRERDQDCYECHVTGAFHPDGPHDPGAVAGLESVGCESCHGPGKAHAATPTLVEMVKKPEESVCRSCHDGVRDEGRFNPEEYLAGVKH